MRLSTKGRFAVTAMIDVGLRQKAGPVSLNDISARHHISMSYLEQMFARLRRSGLVESTRGPGGGYTLARPARDISVADIITAVETTDDDEAPRAGAEDGVSAMTAQLWSELQARMLAYMQSISLEQLDLPRERLRRRGQHLPRAHDAARARRDPEVVQMLEVDHPARPYSSKNSK